MSYRSDGGGPAAPASGHGAVAATATLAPQSRAATVSDPARQRGSGGAGAVSAPTCPPLTGPDFVLTMWGASCPAVWSRGRRASPRQRGSCLGRRRSDVVPGPTKPVQALPSTRRGASSRTCDRPQRPRNHPPRTADAERRSPCLEAGRPPVHTTARSDPATIPPAQQTTERRSPCLEAGRPPVHTTARSDPATLPPQSRRASDPSTDAHDSQSKEASQSKNQPPLSPPDPLQKSEKKIKDNPKWRIN